MGRRILVLGAGGFLGRAISAALVESAATTGDEVVLHYRTAESAASCAPLGFMGATPLADLTTATVRDVTNLLAEVEPDVVVNCVGVTRGSTTEMDAVNVDVVFKLIVSLGKMPHVRLVHLGSAAEYGAQRHGTMTYESTLCHPVSHYGSSKLIATDRLLDAAMRLELSIVVLRIFNPIGAHIASWTLPGHAARALASACRDGVDSITLGSLSSWRDYVDVRDIASAVVASTHLRAVRGAVLNIGRGVATSSRELVESLARLAGFDGRIDESGDGSSRSAAVAWQCADITAARRALAWAPRHALEASLVDLWSHVNAGVRA
jgi:nucleoside-diphosphate-sugar epimerase